MVSEYDLDKVEELIQAATGVSRILNIMACDAEPEDFAQSNAYYVLSRRLWDAVESVTGESPMLIGTRYQRESNEEA